jgi:hypothetical protein
MHAGRFMRVVRLIGMRGHGIGEGGILMVMRRHMADAGRLAAGIAGGEPDLRRCATR